MITGYIVGDRELIAKLQAAPHAMLDRVAQTVDQLGVGLARIVTQQYLSGPRPARLGRVTGRLVTSIPRGGSDTRSRMEKEGSRFTAYVGTNVPYGIAWEQGFARKVGAGARGGPRTLQGQALATYFARHPPGIKQIPARAFLAPALDQYKPTVIAELQKAVSEGVQAALK